MGCTAEVPALLRMAAWGRTKSAAVSESGVTMTPLLLKSAVDLQTVPLCGRGSGKFCSIQVMEALAEAKNSVRSSWVTFASCAAGHTARRESFCKLGLDTTRLACDVTQEQETGGPYAGSGMRRRWHCPE